MNARIANLLDISERKGSSVRVVEERKQTVINALGRCNFFNWYAITCIEMYAYNIEDDEDTAVVQITGDSFSIGVTLHLPTDATIPSVELNVDWSDV